MGCGCHKNIEQKSTTAQTVSQTAYQRPLIKPQKRPIRKLFL